MELGNEIRENFETLKLTNDFVFKLVFGAEDRRSQKSLIELLNTLLQRTGKNKIAKIDYKNPINYREFEKDKSSILDIEVETENGELIDIEMQVEVDDFYKDRAIYNCANLLRKTIQKTNY